MIYKQFVSFQHSSNSHDVVCGRIITISLRRFNSQLKSSQESRRTPFDIGPLTPAEEKKKRNWSNQSLVLRNLNFSSLWKKKKKLPLTLNITILDCKHATLLFGLSSLPAYIWLNWGVVMMQVWRGFRLINAVKANPVECSVIPINMIFHLKHHNNTKDIRKRKGVILTTTSSVPGGTPT